MHKRAEYQIIKNRLKEPRKLIQVVIHRNALHKLNGGTARTVV